MTVIFKLNNMILYFMRKKYEIVRSFHNDMKSNSAIHINYSNLFEYNYFYLFIYLWHLGPSDIQEIK